MSMRSPQGWRCQSSGGQDFPTPFFPLRPARRKWPYGGVQDGVRSRPAAMGRHEGRFPAPDQPALPLRVRRGVHRGGAHPAEPAQLAAHRVGAGPGTARTVLRRYGPRWRTGCFLHAPRQGTRTGDRRLDHADDLSGCLAFDAITAFRVRDLSLLARGRPDDPATWHVAEDGIRALRALAAHHGFRVARGPPDMTVVRFVTLTGGLAGFHPLRRQPLPGTRKLWEGVRLLSSAVIAIRAMRDREGNGTEGKDMESSVMD